jgi:hypothetical protein
MSSKSEFREGAAAYVRVAFIVVLAKNGLAFAVFYLIASSSIPCVPLARRVIAFLQCAKNPRKFKPVFNLYNYSNR